MSHKEHTLSPTWGCSSFSSLSLDARLHRHPCWTQGLWLLSAPLSVKSQQPSLPQIHANVHAARQWRHPYKNILGTFFVNEEAEKACRLWRPLLWNWAGPEPLPRPMPDPQAASGGWAHTGHFSSADTQTFVFLSTHFLLHEWVTIITICVFPNHMGKFPPMSAVNSVKG